MQVFYASQGTLLSFPVGALLFGGLIEIVMGLVGILYAGALMVGLRPAKRVAEFVALLLTIFAWYIFIVFVFIQPGMDAAAVPGTPYPWTSRQTYNTFIMAGILAAAFYCAVLLGGQVMSDGSSTSRELLLSWC